MSASRRGSARSLASSALPELETTQVADAPRRAAESARKCDLTIVAHSGDFDKVMAALIIATGAAASGRVVSIFFTFWGLNALRSGRRIRGKPFVERLIGWMMPRGPDRLPSSRMNMGGAGPRFFRHLMKKRQVQSVSELLNQCVDLGVRLVACQMSMEMLGIRRDELREEVELAGVTTYLLHAEGASHNLFI